MVQPKDSGANLEQSPPLVHFEKTEVTLKLSSSYNLQASFSNGVKNSSGERLSGGRNIRSN
jgi:hypothetical protein